MKIENNFNASCGYLTIDDIGLGEVFRVIGDTELLLNAEDGPYKLSDGSSVYLDTEPVEVVLGHFTVDKIIGAGDYKKNQN